jgi:hypothetical protein
MKSQVVVLCVVTPCSVVVGFRRFRGPCCLHLGGEVAGMEILSQHYMASQSRRPRLVLLVPYNVTHTGTLFRKPHILFRDS